MMNTHPALRAPQAHARKISKDFNLRLTHSQNIVANIQNCSSWSELKSKVSNHDDVNEYKISFHFLPSKAEIGLLKDLIAPYLEAIKEHYNSNKHGINSLIKKIASENYNHISSHTINNIHNFFGKNKSKSHANIIDLIEFEDNNFSRALYFKQREVDVINTHLRPKEYGQNFYAYYKFNHKELYILSREWDLEICIPPHKNQKGSIININHAYDKKWYIGYMVGYLKLLINEFKTCGYNGKIRICNIQNISVKSFYDNSLPKTRDKIKSEKIHLLFRELLDLGGSFVSDCWGDETSDLGIEIPFEKL